ncbi:hypothetical protein U6B65_07270 [Oscillospiraceae bacterium MB08-C2-2]|nr:hypothetical protein U6B65_07270 [Oscillospiraceae bacterium MB08-C2-2]
MAGRTDARNVWYQLDNAARIFPAVSDERNTNVFRLTCEFVDNVDKVLLQKAVDQSLVHFPYFQVVLRRGLFWYYLERTTQRPLVTLETRRPCDALFYSGQKNLLFSVTYYRRRVNLEVFHAISDGSGAYQFLRTIAYNYIRATYLLLKEPSALPPLDVEASPAQQAEDSFQKYYDPSEKKSFFGEKAYHIGGTLLPRGSLRIIEGSVDTKEVLALAKSKGATLTAYTAALIICAIYDELMPKRAVNRPIRATIPVDLRGHFGSATSRNFFTVVEVGYNFHGQPADFDAVLQSIVGQMKAALTRENLAQRFNYTMSVQNNIFARPVPLVLKNFVLRMAYNQGEAGTTFAISNLGRITMPELFSDYITGFATLLNPTPFHRLKLAVTSYGSRLIFSFSTSIEETQVQKSFFRHLTKNGLHVCITSNEENRNEIL